MRWAGEEEPEDGDSTEKDNILAKVMHALGCMHVLNLAHPAVT